MALKGQVELKNLSSDPTSGLSAGQMYYNTGTNKVRVYNGTSWGNVTSSHGLSMIPSSGLELHLDANNSSSYGGSGTQWSDLSGNNRHFQVNASSFVSTGIKHFDFSSQYRAVNVGANPQYPTLTDVPNYTNRTIITFSTVVNNSNDYQTLVRGATSDHQVIVWDNGFNLGIATSNFYDSGYDITSIPNYNTKFNGQFYRLSSGSSPYWAFSLNDASGNAATITSMSPPSNNGFCVIGGYHNNSTSTTMTSGGQPWGKIHAFLYYSRHITFSEQEAIYNYYKTTLGI